MLSTQTLLQGQASGVRQGARPCGVLGMPSCRCVVRRVVALSVGWRGRLTLRRCHGLPVEDSLIGSHPPPAYTCSPATHPVSRIPRATHPDTPKCPHSHTPSHTNTCTHTHMHAPLQIDIQAHRPDQARPHIHTYTHTHTDTPTDLARPATPAAARGHRHATSCKRRSTSPARRSSSARATGRFG